MATTATITLASDVYSGFGGITKTMDFTKAGNSVDIDATTGFQRRKLNAISTVDLITMASLLIETEDSASAKIYIRNIGDGNGNITKLNFVLIGVNSQPVGRLYGGDWMVMPLTGIDADDVTATPETAHTVVLEYIMYYQEDQKMAFTKYHNITGSSGVDVELLAAGDKSSNVKSIWITNTRASNAATVSLYINNNTTNKKYYFLSTLVIPANGSLLLDDSNSLSFDNSNYGLYMTVGSSDTLDVIICK